MTRKKLIEWAIVVIMLIVISAGGYFTDSVVSRQWNELINYETSHTYDLPAQKVEEKPLSHRVIVLVVDGLRDDALQSMPRLNEMEDNLARWQVSVPVPSQNVSSWATFLTGTTAEVHGIATGLGGGDLKTDSITAAASRRGLPVVFAGNHNWKSLIDEHTNFSHYQFVPQDEDSGIEPDRTATGVLLDQLASRPEGLFILNLNSLNGLVVDEGIPRGSTDSTKYHLRLEEIDQIIANVAGAVDPTRDTLLILSSHGFTERGGYGGPEAEVTDVPLLMMGRGIASGSKGTRVLPDVAPTVAGLLGLEIPIHSTGTPITGALDAPSEIRQNILLASARTQRNFYQSYIESLGQTRTLSPPDPDAVGESVTSYKKAALSARTEKMSALRNDRLWYLLLAGLITLVWAVLLVRTDYLRPALLGLLVTLAVGFALLWAMGARYTFTDMKLAANFAIWQQSLWAQGVMVAVGLGMYSGLMLARHGNYTLSRLFSGTLYIVGTSLVALVLLIGLYIYAYGMEIQLFLPPQRLWTLAFSMTCIAAAMGRMAILSLGMSWLGARITVNWWLD